MTHWLIEITIIEISIILAALAIWLFWAWGEGWFR